METTLCLATRIHETFLCNGVSVYAFHPRPPTRRHAEPRRPREIRAVAARCDRRRRARAAAAGLALSARPRRDAGPCGRPPLAASVGRPIARPRAARPRRAV